MSAARLAAAVLALIASGCLSAERLRRDVRSGASEGAIVENVPFFRQRRSTCGQSALASAMCAAGARTSHDAITGELAAGGRGTPTFDLALYARSKGLLAVQSCDLGEKDLVAALRAGVTPVVMLGGVLSVIGRYHYAVLTGFDRSRRVWLMHYGVRPAVLMRAGRLATLRRNAGDWVMLVASPEAAPEGLRPEIHMEMGLQAEKAGRRDSALHHYARAAEATLAAQAFLNMSNVESASGRLDAAEGLLRRSLAVRPDFAEAKNNLAWVILKRGGDLAEAESLAREASDAEGAAGSVRDEALDTLAAVLEAAGRASEAEAVRRLIRPREEPPGRR